MSAWTTAATPTVVVFCPPHRPPPPGPPGPRAPAALSAGLWVRCHARAPSPATSSTAITVPSQRLLVLGAAGGAPADDRSCSIAVLVARREAARSHLSFQRKRTHAPQPAPHLDRATP